MLQPALSSTIDGRFRAMLGGGFVAEHVREFADWLDQQGFRPYTIADLLRTLSAWTAWMRRAGFADTDLRAGLVAYRLELGQRAEPRDFNEFGQRSLVAASRFMQFLQDRGIIEADAPPPSPISHWPLLGEFRTWMREHRGLAESSLDEYQRVLVGLVETVGDIPSLYTTEKLRDYVLERARPFGIARAKSIVSAVRSFLRFLAVTGRCRSGMEYAIPGFACWRLSSVPKFLKSAEVERIIGSCMNGRTGIRDKAVLLLLARLGLRASEVARLKFDDIYWPNGRIIVCGKGRHEEWLPLPQEVGDAVLLYLHNARPRFPATEVFITVNAPLRPISRLGITEIVRSALKRTGIKAPINGVHVLRHSVAASMLQQGISLAGIGAVLRHRSPDTTANYAKVDFQLLAEIAQPWPEVPSC